MVLQTCNDILHFQGIEKNNIDVVLKRLDDYMLVYKNIGSPFVLEQKEKDIHIIDEKKINPINNIECIKESELVLPIIENPPVINIDKRIQILKQENQNTINPFILPKQKDTLFWSLFIAKYGYAEYIQVDRNYGMKELEIKSQVANFLKANPTRMKDTNYKVTKILIQEIMSELMTIQKETSMFCLLAIIVFFDMNIIMIEHTSRFLVEFQSNNTETTPTFLIQRDDKGRYHIKCDPITIDEIKVLKEERLCLENFMKPIKPISSYKVNEIEEILQKIGVFKEGEKDLKMKKQDLYELLKKNVVW